MLNKITYLLTYLLSSRNSALSFHPANNLGSSSFVTLSSHWWHLERHPANNAPVYQKEPLYSWWHSRPSQSGERDIVTVVVFLTHGHINSSVSC